MLNSLEHAKKYLTAARAIIDRNEKDEMGKHHGIIGRHVGYMFWKFYKKSKSQEHLN